MESLKKIVTNQYFPAAAVLTAVLLFWTIAMFGGLSLLHNNQPPMATLTWLLFVYGAAVLTPLAGIIAATDLIRRWRRNRQYAQVEMVEGELAQDENAEFGTERDEFAPEESLQDEIAPHEAAQGEFTQGEPVTDEQDDQQPTQESTRQSAPTQPVQYRPATHQTATQHQPAKKQPGQAKQRKTAA